MGKPTENGNEVKNISSNSLEILDKGLNSVSSKIECIEIAWGQSGQRLLNDSKFKHEKQRLNQILTNFSDKLYQFKFVISQKNFPIHFAGNNSEKKLEKLTRGDFDTYLG